MDDPRETLRRRAPLALLALAFSAAAFAAAVGVVVVAVRVAPDAGTFFAGLGAVTAGTLLLALVAAALSRRVKPNTLLELDLTGPLRDRGPGDPFRGLLSRGRPGLREIVAALEHAAADRRVAGLVARVGPLDAGLADVQEVRDAVASFREAGKFAVVHADTFGEFGGGSLPYYLATAFDEVWLQPSGEVGLVGTAAEVNFLRGALDRVGVLPQIDHRHEYKNAKNVLTETGFTPAHREATERLVASQFEQVVAGVAAGRGLDAAAVRDAVDAAPIPADAALATGLVDRIGYRDEAVDAARERVGAPDPVALDRYRKRVRTRRGTPVAFVHGAGPIVRGRSRPHPLGGRAMGAETVAAAFHDALESRKVRAVIFRVDSRGGSYVASDAIWRAVVRARERGKPVVVTMGNVAASGGYFVALGADRIIAHPATITGSIGVVGGKAVVADLKTKLGVTTEAVQRGVHALAQSPSRPYADGEWERLQGWLDRVYADFTARVADARGFDDDDVQQVARGRVWTGADAAAVGLVDVLGGYPAAQAAVRELLDLPADAPLRLVAVGQRRGLRARLRQARSELDAATEPLAAVGAAVRREAAAVGVLGDGALRMPDVVSTR